MAKKTDDLKTTDSSSDSADSEFSYLAKANCSCTDTALSMTVDSGCTVHMTPSDGDIRHPVSDSTPVQLADGSTITSTLKGHMKPGFSDHSSHPCIVVPGLKESLLSVSKLADDGVVSVFDKNQCVFYR